MNEVFVNILNASVTASFVVLAVLLLRLGMKKAPKWITVALWALVGARLVFPFAIESRFSVIPTANAFSATPKSADSYVISQGLIAELGPFSEPVATVGVTGNTYDFFEVLTALWLIGLAALLIYGTLSCFLLYGKVRTAIPLRDNVYQSEYVKSPFVMGFIKPKIYVPFNLDEDTLEHVLAHEKAHIKRGDHIIKPFAYVLLSIHWFNPLIWLSYILLCRDIEVACDEKVIKNLPLAHRKSYALALLNCKAKNSTMAVCPVAFGEVSVSSRIKKTLKYKKPAMWIAAVSVAVAIAASGFLLTNPKAETFYCSEGPAVYTTEQVVTSEITENSASETTPAATTPKETEALTFTEPATEAPAEVYEEYYDEYYYEDYYYDEYYYEEQTLAALQPLEIEPVVPSWIENGSAVNVWNYEAPLSTVEKQNQALIEGSDSWEVADIVNNNDPWYPTYEVPGSQHLPEDLW